MVRINLGLLGILMSPSETFNTLTTFSVKFVELYGPCY